MSEMIVAVFDTPVAADAAVRDVEAAALPSAVIRRYDKADPDLVQYRAGERRQSFWSWLFGEEPPAPEQEVYERSLAAGGIVVTVTVDEAQAPRVMEILHRHAPLDIDEHAARYSATAAARIPPTVPSGTVETARRTTAYDAGVAEARTGKEEVIPLAEEQLTVGKRTVDRGTTRIRRYVVRTPVEKPVTLHEEQVTIERRRPVAAGERVPEGAFEERTTEVHTTSEEPVVTKTPRVAEEVVVRKDARDRTETVRDTVRREEVEVQKQGGKPTDVAPAKPTAAPRTRSGQAPMPPAE